jgi:hypothetical protein
VSRNLHGKRLPVLWNSNPQANEGPEFYCVASEWTDSFNGIAPNFAARAKREGTSCGMTSSAGKSGGPIAIFS